MSNDSPVVYMTMELLTPWYNEKRTHQQQGENIENNKYIGKNRKHNNIWFNPP